jgi:hypothetical protein
MRLLILRKSLNFSCVTTDGLSHAAVFYRTEKEGISAGGARVAVQTGVFRVNL